MKRNYKLKPLKNIIESFVEQDSISNGIFNIKIQKAWENAVEKKILDYTKEIYVKGEVLYIKVSRKLNRCLFFPNVTIKAKKVFDETGKQVRKHLVINDRDDYVWTKIRERHLNADVELLKKFIKEYK